MKNEIFIIFLVLFQFQLSYSKFINNLYHTKEETFKILDYLSRGGCKNPMTRHSLQSDINKNEEIVYYSLNGKTPSPSQKKTVMIFGEHSRELLSSEQALFLIRQLCGDLHDFDKNTVDSILNINNIIIVPMVNVPGREKVEAGDYCWRTNENNIDLNRNWDSHWDGSLKDSDQTPGSCPFSEWQTRSLKTLLTTVHPDIFISTHSGALGLYTPLAYKKIDFEKLSISDAKKLNSMVNLMKVLNDKYCKCKAGSIGNELWYLCPGTCLDYAYENLNIQYTFAFEIYNGYTKNPHFIDILNSNSLKTFNYRDFLADNGKEQKFTGFLQMKATKGFLQQKYKSPSYTHPNDSNFSCFVETSQEDGNQCLKQMNPLDEKSLKNTLITWTNIFFELFARIYEEQK